MFGFKTTFLMFTLFLFSPPYFAEAGKPRPPIQIMLQQTDISEKEILITLTALAHIDTESASLLILLPPHVLVIKGDEKWEGPLEAGAKQTLAVTIQSSGPLTSGIEGKASIRLSNGTTFEQQIKLILEPSVRPRLAPRPPVKQKGSHEGVLEFRGK